MDSFNQAAGFCYNPSANQEDETGFSGILQIYVHHARNIHNICIYDNQDVYAKFSLTYNPDEAIFTRIINGGGKNPEFNENLIMKVAQPNAVLKCEIWMLSRAKNFMEDQLLGFALAPISSLVGKEKVTQDFILSSTDLFHSPAGTVKLTLSLNTNVPLNSFVNSFSDPVFNTSITSEVVLLDRKISEVVLDPVEYSSLEFPDVNLVKENQQMVSEYFNLARHGSVLPPGLVIAGSFLHLGSSHQQLDECEMAANSSEENWTGSISPDESIHNSGFLSSTMTSLSDDRNSADSLDKKNRLIGESSNSRNPSITRDANQSASACPDRPTSIKVNEVKEYEDLDFSGKEEIKKEGAICSVKFGQMFSAPLGNINLEAEQSVMQQQIVDMYMRSMQQFTESLTKMKLPMDLDKPEAEDHGDVIQSQISKVEVDKKKKDVSRVFYGSRAFF